MQDLKQKTAKKRVKTHSNKNPLEALGGIMGGLKDSAVEDLGKGTIKGIKDSVVKDIVGGGVSEAWKELLNEGESSPKATQGDLSEGAEMDLGLLQEKTVEVTEMHNQYTSEVIHAGKRASTENSQEMQVKVQEILIEIKKLSQSSKELKQEVEIISMEQTMENPGVYHVSYLEKMLTYIRDIRLNVEDSLAWFSSLRSKKASRQYGKMAKKHGTTFTLSGERQVSTQTG